MRELKQRQASLEVELKKIEQDLKSETQKKKLMDAQTAKADAAKKLIGGLYSSGNGKKSFDATGLQFTPGHETAEMNPIRPNATFTDEFNSQHFHGGTFRMFYREKGAPSVTRRGK